MNGITKKVGQNKMASERMDVYSQSVPPTTKLASTYKRECCPISSKYALTTIPVVIFTLGLYLIPAHAEGPRFHHKDPIVDQEFRNVYADIRNPVISFAKISSGTYNNVPMYAFQGAVTNSTIETFSTSSADYQETNLSASITPSSAESRVKITVSGLIDTLGAGQPIISIFRDSSDLDLGSNGFVYTSGLAASAVIPLSISFIDSPSTTSATAYYVKLKSSNGATTVQFGCGGVQTIILEEIR